MNKAELIEALEIAVGNYDFDGEYEKSAKVSEYIEKISTKLEKAQKEYQLASEEEENTEEAIDSMERRYWEGVIDALEGMGLKA